MDAVVAILRRKFYWLGPGGAHILRRRGRSLTLRAVCGGWNPAPIEPYLRTIAARFAALGFKVQWEFVLSEELEAVLDKAIEKAEKKCKSFDREAFIRRMWNRERRERLARGERFGNNWKWRG